MDTLTGDLNQSFTTSIYLNQSSATVAPDPVSSSSGASVVAPASATVASTGTVPQSVLESATQVTVTPPQSSTTAVAATVSTCVSTTGTSSGATSSVYLNKSNPTRHVTRIPINKVKANTNISSPENELQQGEYYHIFFLKKISNFQMFF